jgi:hypothetical protein
VQSSLPACGRETPEEAKESTFQGNRRKGVSAMEQATMQLHECTFNGDPCFVTSSGTLLADVEQMAGKKARRGRKRRR